MVRMKVRLLALVPVIGVTSLVMSAGAMADSASLNLTGPNSDQSVSVVSSATNTVTTNNTVTSASANVQSASTGKVSATNNTSVGSGASGGAGNMNAGQSNVSIGMPTPTPASAMPESTQGGTGSAVVQTTAETTTGGTGGAAAVPSGGQGSVLGASTAPSGGTGGAAILPVTGATVPVDVAAMRAAWHPTLTPENPTVVKSDNASSRLMLIVASILSLTGAAWTGWRGYVKQRALRGA